MQLVKQDNATIFDFAGDAIDCLRNFEAATEKLYQYAVKFDGKDGEISGVVVEVIDFDGVTVGFLRDPA